MPTFAIVLSFFATLLGPAADPECYALGGLDLARAEALADVNVAGLRAVYVDASAAARDEQLLKRYAARGYRVVGAGMVRDECRAVSRTPGRVELDVRDRMAHAWVVSETGEARRLPRDGLTRHRIVLTRADDGWRIASVG